MPAQPCSPTTAGNGPAPSGLARYPCMRSPRMSPPEISRCEPPSNSTRSRGVADAPAISPATTHHSVSTIAAAEVTGLGNSVSLDVWRNAVGSLTCNHGTQDLAGIQTSDLEPMLSKKSVSSAVGAWLFV